jgi:bifunctional non-homologous end joining protein LigD
MPRKASKKAGSGSGRSLKEYRRRRGKPTPEPAAASEGAPGTGNRFVIQEHSATSLHWDLRLEWDGVLASWALPRGLPPDPKRNNMAIRTEDHPISYLEFEGEIPAGSYGAGTMDIWDSGTYEAEKFRDDEVIFTLHGERARARYALFRAGRQARDWMIHRMDPPERPLEPIPERIRPMLPRPGRLPRKKDAWGFEIAWGGVRAIAYSRPGTLRLLDADLRDVSSSFPEVRRLNRRLGMASAVLDGEIVMLDEQGRPDPEALQARTKLRSDSAIRRRAKSEPASFQIFDLLHLDGASLPDLPYEERRRALEELGLEGEAWRTPSFHRGDGRGFRASAAELGLPGIVAKRLDSPYRSGVRPEWVAIPTGRTGR